MLKYTNLPKLNSIKTQTQLPKDYQGIVEQIIRPTGLIDPRIELRPIDPENINKLIQDIQSSNLEERIKNELVFKYFESSNESKQEIKSQVLDLIDEIQNVIQKKQRVFVTTLTKRMSEELTEYLKERGIKVQYLHSDLDAIERVEILRDLRLGLFDVVVGINLLREGLDVPEVSLVAILDADKEGFLRSKTSLVQTIGRAARHLDGKVLMYADHMTSSIEYAISETYRRRKIQIEYNLKNDITPQSIIKDIKTNAILERSEVENTIEEKVMNMNPNEIIAKYKVMNKKEKREVRNELKFQMELFADAMKFEDAAKIRDVLKELV